jgi:hypothetical protein
MATPDVRSEIQRVLRFHARRHRQTLLSALDETFHRNSGDGASRSS